MNRCSECGKIISQKGEWFTKNHWWSMKKYMCVSCEHKFELNIILGEKDE